MLENAAKARESLKNNPEAQAKLKAWQHSPSNPLYDPDVKHRPVTAKQRAAMSHPGGSRVVLTVPQKMIFDRLGGGWETEVLVKTYSLAGRAGKGRPRARPPYWYRLDISNPQLMLALEVDGGSHRGRKESDAKRDAILTALGWTVLRFTNRRVRTNLEGVLRDIAEAVKSSTSRP